MSTPALHLRENEYIITSLPVKEQLEPRQWQRILFTLL